MSSACSDQSCYTKMDFDRYFRKEFDIFVACDGFMEVDIEQ